MIEFQQVSKRYGGQVLLDQVDFRIPAGIRAGIVGPNGAGKSTLFDLMAGDAEADSGSISRMKGIRLGYLRQQLPRTPENPPLLAYAESAVPDIQSLRDEIRLLESQLAGADTVEQRLLLQYLGERQTEYEQKGGYHAASRAAATLAGLGFSPEDLQKGLRVFSGGWQMRAALARALLAEPDLLLLDEPGNYLDLPAVEWLRRRLEGFRGTLVMISHDRYLLESLCTVTFEVARGKVTRYPGSYSFYAREREKRLAASLARQANETRRREQLERFVERFRSKSSLASRVQSKVKMLERMEQTEVEALVQGITSFRIANPPHCGLDILRGQALGFRYQVDGPWIFRNLALTVQRGEKLAVVGPNGAGKTTLLRTLAGQLKLEEGTLQLGHHVVPGYQSQDFADTMPEQQTCYEIIKNAAPDAAESEIRALLGGFGFSGEAIQKKVTVLSGGERIRLAFARILIRPPNLLLLDEPTTHLDIESREALQNALEAYHGTILLVSHDVAFVRAVAKGIWEVRGDGEIRRYAGGYDYYREKAASLSAQEAGQAEAPPENDEKAKRRERYQNQKALESERRKLDKALTAIEQELVALEARRDALHQQLAAPGTSPQERTTAGQYLKEVEAALQDANARWEATGAKRDACAAALQKSR